MVQEGKIDNATLTKNKLSGKKEIVFLNQTPFETDLSLELAKLGFEVKPILSQAKVTEKVDDKRTEQFNQTSARYGLKISATYTGSCVFSHHKTYRFVFSLIDVKKNSIIDVFKQNAPDGPCPPMKSIFPVYSKHLNSLW